MSWSMLLRALPLAAAVLVAASSAGAQMPAAPGGPAFPPPPPAAEMPPPPYAPMSPPPAAGLPPSPEAADIAVCLCLYRDIDALRAQMAGRGASDAASRDEVARLDAQLAAERQRIDVNDPQSVARFRELLEHRDAVFRQSSGATAEYTRVIERYNGVVDQYNTRCTSRPHDPALVGRVEATLSCPMMR